MRQGQTSSGVPRHSEAPASCAHPSPPLKACFLDPTTRKSLSHTYGVKARGEKSDAVDRALQALVTALTVDARLQKGMRLQL
jgi:hypothetical protein